MITGLSPWANAALCRTSVTFNVDCKFKCGLCLMCLVWRVLGYVEVCFVPVTCSCGDNFFLLGVTSFHAILLWWLKCSRYCFVPAAPIWYPSTKMLTLATLARLPQSISECPSLPLPNVSHLILSFEQLLSPSLWPQQSVFVKFIIKFIDQRHFWYFLLV